MMQENNDRKKLKVEEDFDELDKKIIANVKFDLECNKNQAEDKVITKRLEIKDQSIFYKSKDKTIRSQMSMKTSSGSMNQFGKQVSELNKK